MNGYFPSLSFPPFSLFFCFDKVLRREHRENQLHANHFSTMVIKTVFREIVQTAEQENSSKVLDQFGISEFDLAVDLLVCCGHEKVGPRKSDG